MFVTLLLPLVIPYGNPWTAHNPRAHYLRKTNFFRWIKLVKVDYKEYRHVPLLIFEDIEKHDNTFIKGTQTPDLVLVP